ncbi:DUF4249 domain-containing protein [Bacteroides heparinolyticus]|uniref:DUF4249 domain-containing protein n=1 Tax=Prevotella heparinolytica TaxID=28113 RepID=UPI0023F0AF8C|nr:DUF4249 domain-containing protein [Bacteroides heparinolyticus]MCI6212860.1 DUF4249 domain-containing protein [Bacteroides heparinolyticus]
MGIRKIAKVCLSILILLTGCEQVMDVEEGIGHGQGLMLNALAATDTVFTASVSRTFLFTEVPALSYLDYWEYAMHPDSFYYRDAMCSEAQVELSVNGKERYAMRYDAERYNYVSDYMPRSGDRLTLRVRVDGMDEVSAQTVIPASQRLEVVGCEKFYAGKYSTSGDLIDLAKDTIARITLRLIDPKSETNYYRLKVRSIAYDKPANDDSQIIFMYSDIYTSGDVIFMDERLSESYGGWPAYFSNVFDDHLFDGKEYTFSIETRLRFGERPHVVIELQSITRDLYYYLKSVMLYRIIFQDAYTEAVQIHSNVSNGWGILGAIGTEKHVLWLD